MSLLYSFSELILQIAQVFASLCAALVLCVLRLFARYLRLFVPLVESFRTVLGSPYLRSKPLRLHPGPIQLQAPDPGWTHSH